jgi:Ca2+/H+ antiporter, TMEM165/GDT1 family
VDVLVAFAVAYGLILVAELGDKSQLLILWFSTRYTVRVVLAGVALAMLVVQTIAVGIGVAFSEILPDRVFQTIAGLAFLFFAAWTLRPEADEDEESEVSKRLPLLGSVGVVALSVFAAEFGDKTQLATITLAGDWNPIGVWLGSFLALLSASSLAIIVGRVLHGRIPQRAISYVAAALFAIFGVVTLAQAWL